MPWNSNLKTSPEWWIGLSTLQRHTKHSLTCFVPLTSALLHCITNIHTSTGEGRYRFHQVNPQTVLEKQLNGPAHEWVVISFYLFDSCLSQSCCSSCLETFFPPEEVPQCWMSDRWRNERDSISSVWIDSQTYTQKNVWAPHRTNTFSSVCWFKPHFHYLIQIFTKKPQNKKLPSAVCAVQSDKYILVDLSIPPQRSETSEQCGGPRCISRGP